jgi:hypothetical protein
MGRLMAQVQHPPGPPMTLGNMREQGVRQSADAAAWE